MNRAGLLAATSAAIGLGGCALDAPEESSTAGISFEEFKARAGREPGTGAYVVEWDMVIRGDEALYDYWSQIQQGALTIYTVGGAQIKWGTPQKRNLTYCVGGGFGANKQAVIAALNSATALGWQKFADVRYVYVPGQDASCDASNANVTFDVNLAPPFPGYLARSFFPNDPRADRNLLIDVAAFDPAQTGGISLTNILTHELGHTLGFRHEHIRAPGAPCPEDDQYVAVTPYDKLSTMHYPQCGSPGNLLALSALDQSGIAMVYGAPLQNMPPMTNITAPLEGATVPRTFQVSAAVVDTDLTGAELWIDGVRYQTLTAGPFNFQVSGLKTGPHQLEVKGADGAEQISITSVTVTVDGAGGEIDVTGGCSAGGSGGSFLVGLALAGLDRRRRRRRRR